MSHLFQRVSEYRYWIERRRRSPRPDIGGAVCAAGVSMAKLSNGQGRTTDWTPALRSAIDSAHLMFLTSTQVISFAE